MPRDYLGEFEQMVLLSILHLDDEAYGMAIMDFLKRRVGRKASRGTLYITLDRLESKGMIASTVAEPTPERGGRGKRFVTVTPEGVAELRKSMQAWSVLGRGLEDLLGDAP